MRTVPAKFTTDSTGAKPLFYLFSLTTDSTTYHWHTSSETFSLWPNTAASHGGDALTKDATQIANVVDGEVIPIAVMEGSVAIINGGAIGAIGSTTVTILNQDRVEGTILADTLTNRTLVIRKGYVDTTNGVGLNDMVTMKTLIVETWSYSYSTLTLECVDASFLRHREIPNIVIEEDTFPNAPEESLGSCIPILYGDFQTTNTTSQYDYGGVYLYPRYFGVADVAPTVLTDRNAFTFAVSEIGPFNDVDTLYVVPRANMIGRFYTAVTFSADPTSSGFVTALPLGSSAVAWFSIPLLEGTASTATDWKNATDDDEDTYSTGTWQGGAIDFAGADGIVLDLAGFMEVIGVYAIYEVTEGVEGDELELFDYWPQNESTNQYHQLSAISVGVGGTLSKRLVYGYITGGGGEQATRFNDVEVGIRTLEASPPTIRVYHVGTAFMTRVNYGMTIRRRPR